MTYDFDNIELQKVETDQYEGWNVTPGKISFSHIGYRPFDTKVALAGTGAGSDFQITDDKIMWFIKGLSKQLKPLTVFSA